MHNLIVPETMKRGVTAFFTGKNPGADIRSIESILGREDMSVYMPVQKHTDTIVVPDALHTVRTGDAVVTREKGLLIGVQVADCVPILLFDGEKGVCAAVHAGWRGTASGILAKTIAEMTGRFFCSPEDVQVAMGPAIRWCCYAVDRDVVSAVRRASGDGEYFRKKGNKYCLDLPEANRSQARSAGVPESNIWMSGDCTYCHPDRYFSYRYSKGTTGRQGGFIGRLD